MARQKHNAPVDLFLGDLPTELIFKTLGIELEVGRVVFSAAAQIHASRRHPNEFPMCLPYAGDIVTAPLYLGDDARNPGKIECISRVPALRSGVLVALSLEPDEHGCYHVTSIYPIGYGKIEARRASGYLKTCKI